MIPMTEVTLSQKARVMIYCLMKSRIKNNYSNRERATSSVDSSAGDVSGCTSLGTVMLIVSALKDCATLSNI